MKFKIFCNYHKTEITLVVATAVLLAVFWLIGLVGNVWLNTVAALAMPIMLLKVLGRCPLELAFERNSEVKTWIGCITALVAGILMASYPTAWLIVIAILVAALIALYGVLLIGFTAINSFDPYA